MESVFGHQPFSPALFSIPLCTSSLLPCYRIGLHALLLRTFPRQPTLEKIDPAIGLLRAQKLMLVRSKTTRRLKTLSRCSSDLNPADEHCQERDSNKYITALVTTHLRLNALKHEY
jgi:hypothetical protein